MHFQINDLAHPVAVDGAREVIDVLGAITSGWSIHPTTGTAEPAIRVERRRGRYGISTASRQDANRHATAVSAACSLVVDLIEAMVEARPDMLCLHAGAVRIGDSLVVFPSRRGAGKSTLIARLASKGAEVFADDVLPLVARSGGLEARAFGVASRLRLPLPPTLPAEFRRWAAEHAGPRDASYRYLTPPPGGLAAYGAASPVKAFVFLDRGPDDAPPRLHRAPEGAALEALLLQNFGVAASAGDILDRLARLARTAGLFVLRYGALDPAADLLLERFAVSALPEAGPEVPLPLPSRNACPSAEVAGPDGMFRRSEGVTEQVIEGRCFIGDDSSGAIFALDGIGGAIWALLEEPTTASEIEAVLAEAFPAIPPIVIRADVAAFLGDLAARQLVIHHLPETTP